jgi:uncharacterized protein (TIGR02118 family)
MGSLQFRVIRELRQIDAATHVFSKISIASEAITRRMKMAVKLVVLYPRPKDVEAFERVYNRDHVPMAGEKLAGKTKIVATKMLGSPQGTPAFQRIAEIHFPSMDALQACAASEGGKQTIAHAVSISSGGAPTFLVAEEETFVFQEVESAARK